MAELTTGAHRAEFVFILVAVKKEPTQRKTRTALNREKQTKKKWHIPYHEMRDWNQRYNFATHFRAAHKRDTLAGRSRGIPSRRKTIFVDLQSPQIPLQVLLKFVDRQRQVLVSILKTVRFFYRSRTVEELSSLFVVGEMFGAAAPIVLPLRPEEEQDTHGGSNLKSTG